VVQFHRINLQFKAGIIHSPSKQPKIYDSIFDNPDRKSIAPFFCSNLINCLIKYGREVCPSFSIIRDIDNSNDITTDD